jgi:hypothetical protein
MAVLGDIPKLCNRLTSLETLREINNHIAYNLKQLKYHESGQTCGLEANLCLKSPYLSFSTIASSNSLISDFVFVENPLFSQNHSLKRADNGLKSKGLNPKLILETC